MEHNHLEDLQLEVMKEEAPKVWESYREYSVADLEAAVRWLQVRLEAAHDDVRDAVQAGDAEKAEEVATVFAQLKVRHATAQKHLEIRLVHLGEPPEWGREGAIPKWMKSDLTDRKVDDILRNRKIRSEFKARAQNGEKKKSIREDLAEKYTHVSESQIRKILYGD